VIEQRDGAIKLGTHGLFRQAVLHLVDPGLEAGEIEFIDG
jgi:hypothetical protein